MRVVQHSIPVALFLLALAALFFLIFYNYDFGYIEGMGDYIAHYELAVKLERGEQVGTPHLLYHALVILLRKVSGWEDVRLISTVLATSFRVLLGLTLFVLVKLETSSGVSERLILLSVALFLLTAPIYLRVEPVLLPMLFLGFINYLPYHSPTQNLLLLFVIPVSLIALRAVAPQPYEKTSQRILLVTLSIFLVTLLSLSKPSYSIALLPALGLIVLYRLIRRLPIDWLLLTIGLGLPFLFMLGVQYIVTYSDPQRASVELGWLVVFREHWGIQDEVVIARLILSVLFPVSVYLLYIREARRDAYLNFSWLVFGVSLVWSYFFYEGGQRTFDGNFIWSAFAALFALMFSTLMFLLRRYAQGQLRLSPRVALITIVFAAHLVSGIYAAYYLTQF